MSLYDQQLDARFYDAGGAVINVKNSDFGAVGDGVTDDTAAIQAALDAAGGSVVLLPHTSTGYLLGSALTLSAGQTLRGQQTKVLRASGERMLNVADRCLIEGIVFDQQDDGSANTTTRAIWVNDVNDVTFRDCELRNISAIGIAVLGSENVLIERLRCRDVRQADGADFVTIAMNEADSKASRHVRIRDCDFRNADITGGGAAAVIMAADQGSGLVVSDVLIEGCTTVNLGRDDLSGHNPRGDVDGYHNLSGITIKHHVSIDSNEVPIRLFDCEHVTVRDCRIESPRKSGVIVRPRDLDVRVRDILIEGVRVNNSGAVGIWVDGADDANRPDNWALGVRIRDCEVSGAALDGVRVREALNVRVEDVRVRTSTGVGILVTNSTAVDEVDVIVSGCDVNMNGDTSYGIQVTPRENNPSTKITDNHVSDAGGNAIRLAVSVRADLRGNTGTNVTGSYYSFDGSAVRSLQNGLGAESANAETPTAANWQPGDLVDFTDTGDASGDGVYVLGLDGSTWTQLG